MQQLSSLRWVLLGVLLLALVAPSRASALTLPGSDQQIEQSWVDALQQQSKERSEYVNRLALSDSAYLKQHANNPIDWYPWGDVVFARAKKENKLIVLSIGYASCHWCHVMEAESFSDQEVAVALNQSFVSIRDRNREALAGRGKGTSVSRQVCRILWNRWQAARFLPWLRRRRTAEPLRR